MRAVHVEPVPGERRPMIGLVSGKLSVEVVPGFDESGVVAFTTTRAAGSFGTQSDEPVGQVIGRWEQLRSMLAPFGPRLATSHQVHGARVLEHEPGWAGWLRGDDADGHLSRARGTGMAVTVADCVPVFIAHESGAAALLHSGWRGTEARISSAAVARLVELRIPAAELRAHLGPAICGACYEVSPDVYGRLTGRAVARPTSVDLRALIADHVHALGVRDITTSPWCTRCHNERFFSHRAGDQGRQARRTDCCINEIGRCLRLDAAPGGA